MFFKKSNYSRETHLVGQLTTRINLNSFSRDRYQLTGRLLLLSVSGNSLKLSELQLTVGLDTAEESSATLQLSLRGRLPNLTVLLPASCDLKRITSADELDRIRNWALGKAVATAVASDRQPEEEDDRFQLLENEDLTLHATIPGTLQAGDNMFLEEEELVSHTCIHEEAWSLLLKGQSSISSTVAPCTGERERFNVLAHKRDAACSCLLLLPARQRQQAEDLKKQLAQLKEEEEVGAAALDLDSLQVGNLVMFREKVSLYKGTVALPRFRPVWDGKLELKIF
jgi:hypothetical protein